MSSTTLLIATGYCLYFLFAVLPHAECWKSPTSSFPFGSHPHHHFHSKVTHIIISIRKSPTSSFSLGSHPHHHIHSELMCCLSAIMAHDERHNMKERKQLQCCGTAWATTEHRSKHCQSQCQHTLRAASAESSMKGRNWVDCLTS